ncbi:hypothetical protein AbraIFM66951_009090 [Aspergillus brasiliensis]|uniref:DUF7136 domain-containing protein n=1 Tax=Aspergillus brasiliensis TaxID=319629 RepID=A0A9W5Z3F2_9EURO|nr:hypothetical protein AbraCBS73388_004986 [Aspergillus brasiliensis]GKZ46183.1 hypothetical protein AbraIFM66951_009090 [Aspergillus brasiliensis]
MHFLQPRWLLALGAIATTAPAVEVDLVFPRNETYSPTDYFPFVFAVQNTERAELLNIQLSYFIRKSNDLKDRDDQLILNHDLRWTNWSASADPYLAYQYIHNRFNTSSHWLVQWELRWQSCNVESRHRDAGISDHFYTWIQDFSIDNSSLKEVDLVAATANDTCPGSRNAFVINATDTIMSSPSILNAADRDTCVVVANTTASPTTSTPDPCRLAIDEDTAESIASVQHRRLCNGLNPPEDCPKENDAPRLVVLGLSGFLAAIGALGFSIL